MEEIPDFSDMILDAQDAYLRGVPGHHGIFKADGRLKAYLTDALFNQALNARQGRIDFAMNFHGQRLRVAYDNGGARITLFIRRLGALPGINSLGMPKRLLEALLARIREPGLTIICGATGAGKTTTASSLFLESVRQAGDIGITVEDPPEYLMDGEHGKGLCRQTEVINHAWTDCLIRALRKQPKFILIGEIRSETAAHEALRASVNGMSIITTLHAQDFQGAVQRFLDLAGDKELARSMLATGLSAIVHQNLTAPASTGQRRLDAKFLLVEKSREAIIKEAIKSGSTEQLMMEARHQRLKLNQEGKETV